VDKRRFDKQCSLCQMSGVAMALQCDYKSCRNHLHVPCAIQGGLIKSSGGMAAQKEPRHEYNCALFCQEHIEAATQEIKESGYYYVVNPRAHLALKENIPSVDLKMNNNSKKRGPRKKQPEVIDLDGEGESNDNTRTGSSDITADTNSMDEEEERKL